MSHTLSLTFSCVSPCGVRGEGWRRLRACSSERLVWTGRLGGEGGGVGGRGGRERGGRGGGRKGGEGG